MLAFKTDRQKKDWEDGFLDGRLALAVWALVGVAASFGKDLTLTDIWRSRTEAVNLNKLQGLPPERMSPHEAWRAVDIRVADFDRLEIAKMSSVIRGGLHYGGPHAVWYDAAHGTAPHVHLQVGYDPAFDPTKGDV